MKRRVGKATEASRYAVQRESMERKIGVSRWSKFESKWVRRIICFEAGDVLRKRSVSGTVETRILRRKCSREEKV
jgi:hypothetical protein